VEEQLARACIVINAIRPSTIPYPTINVSQPQQSKSTGPLSNSEWLEMLKATFDSNGYAPNPSNTTSGRDIGYSTDAYWTVRIVTISNYLDCPGHFVTNTNTIAICYGYITSEVEKWNTYRPNETVTQDDMNRSIEYFMLHEICHVLIDNDDRVVCFDDTGTEALLALSIDPLVLSTDPIDTSTLGVRDTLLRHTENIGQYLVDFKNHITYARLLDNNIKNIQRNSKARN